MLRIRRLFSATIQFKHRYGGWKFWPCKLVNFFPYKKCWDQQLSQACLARDYDVVRGIFPPYPRDHAHWYPATSLSLQPQKSIFTPRLLPPPHLYTPPQPLYYYYYCCIMFKPNEEQFSFLLRKHGIYVMGDRKYLHFWYTEFLSRETENIKYVWYFVFTTPVCCLHTMKFCRSPCHDRKLLRTYCCFFTVSQCCFCWRFFSLRWI